MELHVCRRKDKHNFADTGIHYASGDMGFDCKHPFPARQLRVKCEEISKSLKQASQSQVKFKSINSRYWKHVESLVNCKDIVMGLSTSGNSPNVIKGIETAKKKGAKTIAMTGETGGKLKGIADLLIAVPSNDTPRIQESHITIGHIICDILELELFKDYEKDEDVI